MLVLTIMIIPITSSICRELFIGVPNELEEGAVGLGATRWEMVKTVIVPSVRGGVVAAVILGLGRALGEAIAVTQVIGNFTPLKLSIFEPGDTLASRTANQYQGAVSNIQVSSLIYLALILLVITFITNFSAQRVVKRFEFSSDGRRMTDAPISLKATGRGRRRLLANRVAELGALAAAAAAIVVLGILVWSVFSRGVHALNWDFFTKGPALFGQTGGGVAPALAGSLLLVGIATAMALPIGVLTAIFVSEFAPRRIGRQVRLWLDVLNGFPSIVIGIFVFALCVKVSLPVVGWGHHQSAFAGGFALAIIMLPLVARATMEVLDARARTICATRATRSASRSGRPSRASSCRRHSAASSPARRSRSRARPARPRRCSSRACSPGRRPTGIRRTPSTRSRTRSSSTRRRPTRSCTSRRGRSRSC